MTRTAGKRKGKLTETQLDFLERAIGGEWVSTFSFAMLLKEGRGAKEHGTLNVLVKRGLLEFDGDEPFYRITPLGRSALKEGK